MTTVSNETPAQKEQYGTENIEAVLTFAIQLGLDLADYLKDGKISIPEGAKLALKVPKALKTGKQIKTAIKEIKDLDPEELKHILSVIIEMLGIETDEDDQ